MKAVFVAAALAMTAGTVVLADPATYKGSDLASQTHLTIDQARAVALKTRPGKVTDQELEKEDGGLRYSFDITSGGKAFEVGVDAQTGRVLEDKAEGKNPD